MFSLLKNMLIQNAILNKIENLVVYILLYILLINESKNESKLSLQEISKIEWNLTRIIKLNNLTLYK